MNPVASSRFFEYFLIEVLNQAFSTFNSINFFWIVVIVLASTSKSWNNESIFGVYGLCSSLGVKMFASSASAINDPKLIGNVCYTVTIVAPPFFYPCSLQPPCLCAPLLPYPLLCKMILVNLEFSFSFNKDCPSKTHPNCVVSNIWLLINNNI